MTRQSSTPGEQRDDLVAVLRERAERIGPDVSVARFGRETGIPEARIYRLFDGWSEVRVLAGLPAEADRHRKLRYTSDHILKAFHAAVEVHGEDISRDEFRRHSGISMSPVRKLFNNWSGLRQEAGLPLQSRVGDRPRFTRDELIEHLKRLIEQRGDVTQHVFCRELGITTGGLGSVISWRELRKELGLPPRSQGGRTTWEKELLTQIPEVPVDLFAGLNLDDIVIAPEGGSTNWRLRD